MLYYTVSLLDMHFLATSPREFDLSFRPYSLFQWVPYNDVLTQYIPEESLDEAIQIAGLLQPNQRRAHSSG